MGITELKLALGQNNGHLDSRMDSANELDNDDLHEIHIKSNFSILVFREIDEVTFIWFLKDMKRHIGLRFH